MIQVVIVGEGPTEATFVRDVLAPALADDVIILRPQLIHLPGGGRGGALSYRRVLRHLRNTLRQRTDTYVTTFASQLHAGRNSASSPEHINDGPDTHPSERLLRILRPGYDKNRHGPLAAERIGLTRICQECRHFAEWLERLRSLRPLA